MGYNARSYSIKGRNETIQDMRQGDILREIRKKCGHVEALPGMGWHFVYNKRHYFCMSGKGDGMVRFCVPHLAKADGHDAERLAAVINETNRNVKFIKAVKLDCGSVSLEYDRQATPDEAAETIVPHIINALDFASGYLLNKLNNPSNNKHDKQ